MINNSRVAVTADCSWTLQLPRAQSGSKQVTVAAGEQTRIPLRWKLPEVLAPGDYPLTMKARLQSSRVAAESASDSEDTQTDALAIHVMEHPQPLHLNARIALFDPQGETRQLMNKLGVSCVDVRADADLSEYDLLIVGKAALTRDGPAPDIARVRDGMKVVVFEQTSEALEQRLGFRVQEYGLRQLFPRVPEHPYLAGLNDHQLRDWRGASTILPARLKYELSDEVQRLACRLMVRPGSTAALAMRQPRQCGLCTH